MIIVRLMGGLGNQMFQYAFGKRMALVNDTELVLDQTLLLDRTQPHELVTHRDFDLDIFNLSDYRWATKNEIFAYNGDNKSPLVKKVIQKIANKVSPKKLVIQNYNEFNATYLQPTQNTCFVGRWQSELFFADASEQIKKEFSFNGRFNDEILRHQKIIESCNAVCLHIRRGDLITSTVYSQTIGALNWSYYENALSHIRKNIFSPTFFVFSDDIEWCKQNVILPETTYYMNDDTAGKKAEGHLYLMQNCKHFIISNSTYAWWGAWISNNTNKIIIYPSNWYLDKKYNNPEICPKNWISF